MFEEFLKKIPVLLADLLQREVLGGNSVVRLETHELENDGEDSEDGEVSDEVLVLGEVLSFPLGVFGTTDHLHVSSLRGSDELELALEVLFVEKTLLLVLSVFVEQNQIFLSQIFVLQLQLLNGFRKLLNRPNGLGPLLLLALPVLYLLPDLFVHGGVFLVGVDLPLIFDRPEFHFFLRVQARGLAVAEAGLLE